MLVRWSRFLGGEKKSFDTRVAQRFKRVNSSRIVMLELIREYEWNFKRGPFLSRTKVRTAQPSFKETFFPPVDQPFPNFHRDNFFPRGFTF